MAKPTRPSVSLTISHLGEAISFARSPAFMDRRTIARLRVTGRLDVAKDAIDLALGENLGLLSKRHGMGSRLVMFRQAGAPIQSGPRCRTQRRSAKRYRINGLTVTGG